MTERSFLVNINQFLSDPTELTCGVPQGSVLGPLLFLLYMTPLGQIISEFSGVSYHLYADDIQLYCSFKQTELHKLDILTDCLTAIKTWLNNNLLQLNPIKTETLIIAPDTALPLINQHLGQLGLSVQPTLRNLGVVFDKDMSLDHHCKQLVKNCFYHLRNIAKLRSMVTKPEMEMIIHAFISSRIDYCNTLFTCFSKKSVNRLQTVQNAAARLLTGTRKRDHITPILYSLHWLPVNFRIHFKILVLTFRALHDQAPSYISELLRPYSPSRSLRSSDQLLLMTPRTRFKTRGDRSFQASAPRLWNALPLDLRSLESTEVFKRELKTYLFRHAFIDVDALGPL